MKQNVKFVSLPKKVELPENELSGKGLLPPFLDFETVVESSSELSSKINFNVSFNILDKQIFHLSPN